MATSLHHAHSPAEPCSPREGVRSPATPGSWSSGGGVAKLGSTALRTRPVSMSGLSALGGPAASGAESPNTVLSPKPPAHGCPNSRVGSSGARTGSSLNPERSTASSSQGPDRPGSGGMLLGFDPLDPSLPAWVPQIIDRLSKLERRSGEGGSRPMSNLNLPESVALGSRMQALEDTVRQTMLTVRTMQATQAEHTNQLYRKERSDRASCSDTYREPGSSGGAGGLDLSGIESRLTSCEVLMSSCSARVEDHDAQLAELGTKVHMHSTQAQEQKSQLDEHAFQLQELEGQLQDRLAQLKRAAEETEQQLAALDAKVKAAATAASAAAVSVAEGAKGTVAPVAPVAAAAVEVVAEGAEAAGKVAELEQRLQTTSALATEVHQDLTFLTLRMDSADRSHEGSNSALQLLARQLTELQHDLYLLKDTTNHLAMNQAAAEAAPAAAAGPRVESAGVGGTGRLAGTGLLKCPKRSVSGEVAPGGGGGAGGDGNTAQLRDLEYRLNKRLNELEAYARKNGGALGGLDRGLERSSMPGNISGVAESNDSYSSNSFHTGTKSVRYSASEAEPVGGRLPGSDRAEISKASVAAQKALLEACKASHEVAAATSELGLLKQAVRMLHEQVTGKAGGGSGSAAAEGAVAAVADATAAAQRKADALETIAKSFAVRLDTIAQEAKAATMTAEHAKQAATAAGLMGGTYGLQEGQHDTSDNHGGAGDEHSPGRGVRFAAAAADGAGGPVVSDVRRLAAQQMELLGHFQHMEHGLMVKLRDYCKSSDLKSLETFVMDKHQQLQQEIDTLKISVKDATVASVTSSLASAAYATGAAHGGHAHGGHAHHGIMKGGTHAHVPSPLQHSHAVPHSPAVGLGGLSTIPDSPRSHATSSNGAGAAGGGGGGGGSGGGGGNAGQLLQRAQSIAKNHLQHSAVAKRAVESARPSAAKVKI